MQRKKGVHYCNQRTDACKMHVSCSYERCVLVCKHVYTYKFYYDTFPEKLFMSIPICITKYSQYSNNCL